jgi:hypothetical protein
MAKNDNIKYRLIQNIATIFLPVILVKTFWIRFRSKLDVSEGMKQLCTPFPDCVRNTMPTKNVIVTNKPRTRMPSSIPRIPFKAVGGAGYDLIIPTKGISHQRGNCEVIPVRHVLSRNGKSGC